MQLAAALILCVIGTAAAMATDAGSAAALRASYAAQRAEIEKNQFGALLHLQSRETSNTLQGDILALIDQPFDKVQAALADPKNWCDILILHPNVKRCQLNTVDAGGEPSMTVNLSRAELPVRFSYKAAAKTADYLDLRGGLERNAMRYYASIESYLDALAASPQQQVERRLRHWYAYTERYPLQLQEEPG